MNITRYVISGMTMAFCLFIAPQAFAQTVDNVKLGIGLKAGFSNPYISDIDPHGLGAASGLLEGDYILEIDRVSTHYAFQVKNIMTEKQDDEPFMIVVKRNESLHSIRIDPTKSARQWPRIEGSDELSDCYFAPTSECIIQVILNKTPSEKDAEGWFSLYTSNVDRLMDLNRPDLAKVEFEKAKKEYYKLPKVGYSFISIISSAGKLGQNIEEKLLSYSLEEMREKNGKRDMGAVLGSVKYLAEYGYNDAAVRVLMHVIDAEKTEPGQLGYDMSSLGEAIAAIQKHELIIPLLKTEEYDSKWGSRLLESAFTYHMKNSDIESAQKIMKIIATFPRSITNDDTLIFIRMLKKAHQDTIVYDLIESLKKQTEESAPSFREDFARNLVKAYGAIGDINMGRKIIAQYFSKDPLVPMMELTIESSNSRSSPGLAVQYYDDLPKLITDTHALIKQAGSGSREYHNSDLQKFYVVMASHLGNNLSLKEYKSHNFDRYDFDDIIETLVEVRKYDEALEWLTESEQIYEKTYGYYDVFFMFGAVAPPDKIYKIRRHPMFKNEGWAFNRAYLKRLYWSGHLDDAAELFPHMMLKEKKIAILGQIPFVIECKKCDL